MASRGEFDTGDRISRIAGILLVARGDEREEPHDVPQLERLRILLASFGAGGCDDLYVALGSRVVAAPTDSSTTFYLPEWYNGLDATVSAALAHAAGLHDIAGVVLQTVDSPDVGDVGVARLLETAAGRSDVVVRVTNCEHWAQPVYIGADLLGDADALLTASGGAIRYLGDHAGDVVTVDCSDLAGPATEALL
ncbi:hypothetical protein GOHSU_12_01170 [Gordonia hirsuta DSM 44140 = NBRC 16056]|uniref:MobA-like NTP transferase domain-containing protein n=1 Tax=Gordonia hirsuta DSM 44140 = NBRC 16056 TaxID=1121927 RepID=L7L9K1_9ACTN|nr:NTP transferase domain-containing protein [Gordonia hirsuta]GAC56727.1 hypothetical protein GOHSU_12_01170 [Gordonia hirsuta DSM 44140 = NBRC 16056]